MVKCEDGSTDLYIPRYLLHYLIYFFVLFTKLFYFDQILELENNHEHSIYTSLIPSL